MFLRHRTRKRLAVALVAATLLTGEVEALATPPPQPEGERAVDDLGAVDLGDGIPEPRVGGPLLAQRERVRRRRRQRTKAALRRMRRRQGRTKRRRSKPRKQKVQVSSPPAAAEGKSWGLELGMGIKRLHLLYTTDIYGRYAWKGCERRPKGKGNISHLIATVARRSKEIKDSGGGTPLVLSAGDMTTPDLLGNLVFRSKRLAPVAVELIRRVGFDGVTIGAFDFGIKPKSLRRYLTLMNRGKVPVLASNVKCQAKDAFPCRHFGAAGKPYLVLERGGLKIGVVAAVRDDLVSRVLTRGRGGISAQDSVEATRRWVRVMRDEEKVDFVVVLATVNIEAETPLPVLDFVRRLGDDAPEVVIANNMYERGYDNYMAQIRRGSGPLIIGTDRYGQTVGEAIVYYRRNEKQELQIDHVGIHRHRVIDTKPAAGDEAAAMTLLRGVCKKVNRTIRGAHFAGAIRYEQFHDYMLDIMRQETKAEVALLNESGVADTTFPVKGKLTREFLLRTIRAETNVVSVWITGARLKALLTPHFDEDTSLRVRGVTRVGGKWKVNGRPLALDQQYRVATTKFVAAGGDALITLNGAEEVDDTGDSLRKTVIRFFKRGGASTRDGDPDIALDDDFPDLSRRWLLSTRFSAGFSFSTVRVDNGVDNARYNLPLLNRAHVHAIYKVDASFAFNATSANHLFQTRGELQFGKGSNTVFKKDASAATPEERIFTSDNEFEMIDRFVIGLTYRLQALRPYFDDRWYALEPYSEGILTGEFTPSSFWLDSAGALQSYRYADVSVSLGLGLRPASVLFIKFGAAGRGELFTPSELLSKIDSPVGIYGGFVLDKWRVSGSAQYPLALTSRADFYYTGFGKDDRAELTVSSKLSFGLTRWLAVKVQHRLFFVDNSLQRHSIANDLTVGFDLAFEYRRQMF